MRRLKTAASLLLVTVSQVSAAADVPDKLKQSFVEAMMNFDAGGQLEVVVPDSETGLYLLITDVGGTAYINKSADTLYMGSVLKYEDGQVINKTRDALVDRARAIPPEWTVEYKGKGKEVGVVSVFFDVSCSYCKAMHSAVKELNNYGVTVRYIAYPRAGLNSEDAQVMRSIWCRPNATKNLDEYLEGYQTAESLAGLTTNPNDCGVDVVEKGYYLGKSVRIKGTPALLFENKNVRNYAMSASSIYQEVLKGSKER